MYAPNKTRSDGGIVMAGLGFRAPTIELDLPVDDIYRYAPAIENGGGGGVWTETEPAYGRPTVWPTFVDQPPPIGDVGRRPRNWGLPYYYDIALQPQITPAAPDVISFSPQQGEITVVTEPGQPPRMVVNLPGVRVDTAQIGQPATPSVGNSMKDLTDWLQNKTIFSSVPNWVVLVGGYFAFDALSKGGR